MVRGGVELVCVRSSQYEGPKGPACLALSCLNDDDVFDPPDTTVTVPASATYFLLTTRT